MCLFINLSRQNASATNSLDLFFGLSREKPGLNDDGLLWQVAFAENLEVSRAADVDDGCLLGVLLVLDPGLLGYQRPQFVEVDGRTVLVRLVGVHVEVAHTDLTEVAGMVLVEVDAVVMLTTSVTATSRMLPVLADTSVAVGNVAAELPGLLLVSTHGGCNKTLSLKRKRKHAGLIEVQILGDLCS